MGRRGDAFDNAVAESFFATLETELIDRHSFRRRDAGPARRLQLHRGLLQPTPPHSSLGYLSPTTTKTTPAGGHRCLKIRCQRKRVTSRTPPRHQQHPRHSRLAAAKRRSPALPTDRPPEAHDQGRPPRPVDGCPAGGGRSEGQVDFTPTRRGHHGALVPSLLSRAGCVHLGELNGPLEGRRSPFTTLGHPRGRNRLSSHIWAELGRSADVPFSVGRGCWLRILGYLSRGKAWPVAKAGPRRNGCQSESAVVIRTGRSGSRGRISTFASGTSSVEG